MICESDDEDEEITIQKVIDIVRDLSVLEKNRHAITDKIDALTTQLDVVPKCRKINGVAMTGQQLDFINNSLIPLAKGITSEKLGTLLTALDIDIELDSKISYTVYYPSTRGIYD